jgi:ABC-type multidrug transport system fused ATPase/permease subunit
MNRSEAPATTSYTLSAPALAAPTATVASALRRLAPLMADEKTTVALAFLAIVVSSSAALIAPVIISRAIDVNIRNRDFAGLLGLSAVLLAVYLIGLVATYFQTQRMGSVGRRVLFKLRNALFTKLQELPLDFFNQNKSGDLISRINNDTDKLNQFFAQSLVQLASNVILMAGAAILLLSLNPRVGAAALLPALGVLIVTRSTSAWIKQRNLQGLQTLGGLSAEIQESLSNFKVIVAFNRLDYFRQKFDDANRRNYAAAVKAGVASNMFVAIFGLALNLAQLLTLAYGAYLIASGSLTVGLLIGVLLYVNNFYFPLRQLAAVWASFQLALAGLDRISAVLKLESNMPVGAGAPGRQGPVLEFEDVHFTYPGGQEVLKGGAFALERGKTYALVGPTGGGKTTTASLMARLYDPTSGRVLLDGKDVRSYQPQALARKVGFILQEPFLFSGTIRDNLVYGNEPLQAFSNEHIVGLLTARNLGGLLARFPQGLDTPVSSAGDAISLGQKQLVAFMRAVLRDPELLILDEATANIDTVTEQLLEDILTKLPGSTTKVIIAHRLNTIANADEILFINVGDITPAGSMQHALDMLMHGKRES